MGAGPDVEAAGVDDGAEPCIELHVAAVGLTRLGLQPGTDAAEGDLADRAGLPAALGGRRPGVGNLGTLEIYDPAADHWQSGPAMPTARGGLTAAALDGALHVTGGESLSSSATFGQHEVYDPTSDRWTTLPAMPVAVHGVTGLAFVDGWIHLPGGGTSQGGSSGSKIHQVYRPVLRCEG